MADEHDRAYTRAKSYSKAMRKYHIDRDRAAGRWSPWYDNLHQYANNKIHCSCSLCAAKSKNRGTGRHRGGKLAPTHNPTMADRRKIDNMDSQLKEEENYD